MDNEFKREWLEADYYSVLGVSESATADEISKAYRKLARKYHPDRNAGDAAAEERFKEISAAYDVIGDETRRGQYDQVRRLGPLGGAFGGAGGPGAGPGGFSFNMDDLGNRGDLGDLGGLLGSMFAGAGGAGFGTPQGRGRARPGRDLDASLTISFDEAVRGITTSLAISHGSDRKTIKVRIPAGVESGQKIRLRSKGGPGNPPGDLYVVVSVEDHPLFGRKGDRLTLQVPITITEAALGADIEVPTYAGDSVTVRIAPGTQTGQTLRVRGAGAPTGDGTGDLLVTVNVVVPDQLTAEQQAALSTLAELDSSDPRRALFGVRW